MLTLLAVNASLQTNKILFIKLFKVTNDYHISSLAVTTESNKIVISDDIVLFNDWMTNPKNIKIIYKNLITSIS